MQDREHHPPLIEDHPYNEQDDGSTRLQAQSPATHSRKTNSMLAGLLQQGKLGDQKLMIRSIVEEAMNRSKHGSQASLKSGGLSEKKKTQMFKKRSLRTSQMKRSMTQMNKSATLSTSNLGGSRKSNSPLTKSMAGFEMGQQKNQGSFFSSMRQKNKGESQIKDTSKMKGKTFIEKTDQM